MNRKWMAVALLPVLMLSVCVLALAEEPTDPVYPVPGPLEKHEHTISIKIVDRGYTAHRLNEWCPDCGRLLKERIEGHNFVDGVCMVCDWECPHPPEAAEKHYERDGVKPQWDGNYIIGPGWEITECGVCHTVLSRVETTVREFHNIHTHFTPVLECLPHDADTHALIRYCDECGTEVPEYVPHNCPPSDRPYTDEGDPDTHSRLVRCADCGFWVPQQQAHTWVHDSYRKDDTDGGEEGHIEVMKCSVCGAKKEVWQPHANTKRYTSYQYNDPEIHGELLQCGICKERYTVDRPHDIQHYTYHQDGNTATHIDVKKCTVCGQKFEERAEHKLQHIIWKNVSDTQHQEIVRCNICGWEIKRNPEAHQFDSFVYVSNDMGSHTVYRACSKCGAVEKNGKTYTEGHTFSGRSCTKCNQSAMHEFSHTFGRFTGRMIQFDDVYHVEEVECGVSSCIVKYVDVYCKRMHTYDPITMKCTACGFLKEGCEHRYTQVLYQTKDGHSIGGKCVKCGKPITEPYFESHKMQTSSKYCLQYSEKSHTVVEIQKCAACGYQIIKHTGETAHKFVQEGNNQRCKECGYLKQSTCEHSFESTPDPKKQTATTHYCQLKCTKCGVETFKYEEHDLKLLSDPRWGEIDDKICVKFHGIFEGKEQRTDIRKVWRLEV